MIMGKKVTHRFHKRAVKRKKSLSVYVGTGEAVHFPIYMPLGMVADWDTVTSNLCISIAPR